MTANQSLSDHLRQWPIRLGLCLCVIAAAALVAGVVGPATQSTLVKMATLLGLITAGMIAVEMLRCGGSAATVGLHGSMIGLRHAALGAATGVAALGSVLIVGLLLGATISSAPSGHGIDNAVVAVSAVLSVILHAYGEEFVFRGPIFGILNDRFGPIWAIVVTSITFSVAHSLNPGISVASFINVFLAGVLLGTLVVFTRSLWASISFHVVWNLLVTLFFGSLSGIQTGLTIVTLDFTSLDHELRWLLGDDFGIESGGITTIVLLACTVAATRITRFDPYVQAARFRRDLAERARQFNQPSIPIESSQNVPVKP
jgi:membrane protease YdiL (CAAX protease family)